MITSDKVRLEYEYVDPCICNAWVATAIIGGVASAGAQIYGANKAAKAQTDAANTAAQMQREQYTQSRADLAPFRDVGSDAANNLRSNIDKYTAPITMDQATLEQTPGYQFNLTQGLKAAQNSAAMRGLGTSGAALKGATTFATGLADSTYQNQFSNAVTNQTNAFNRLKGLVDTGENASAQTGTLGQQSATNQGTAIVGAGVAQGAADNKMGSAISGLANNISGYAQNKGLYGSGGSSGGNSNGSSGYINNPTYGNTGAFY
jgi:hypothetical protein